MSWRHLSSLTVPPVYFPALISLLLSVFPTSADAYSTSPRPGAALWKEELPSLPFSRVLCHLPVLAEPWLFLESLFPLSPSPVGAVSTPCSPQTPEMAMSLAGASLVPSNLSLLPLFLQSKAPPLRRGWSPPPLVLSLALSILLVSVLILLSPPLKVASPAPPTECILSPLQSLFPRA